MNKDQFIEEMLNEVKNLKDLAKEEMPLLVQEYINATTVRAWLGLTLGAVAILIGGSLGLYACFTKGDPIGFAMIGTVVGTIGLPISICNIMGLIDLYMQPRRMAIKAITSLRY